MGQDNIIFKIPFIKPAVCCTSPALTYEKKREEFCKGFFSGFLLDLLAAAKSKLSVLWKSSKLIIQYSYAPQLAEMTGLTSYRQGWLWSPKPLSGHYTSLSLIRLTDPGKNLYRICLDMLVCKQGDLSAKPDKCLWDLLLAWTKMIFIL